MDGFGLIEPNYPLEGSLNRLSRKASVPVQVTNEVSPRPGDPPTGPNPSEVGEGLGDVASRAGL